MNTTAFETLAGVAADPMAYAAHWKAASGRPVVGCLPMNFPLELVDAAGALPLLLQEDGAPITLGNAVFPAFYCGFTRSLVDQAVRGAMAGLDAIYFVDNCVQLIGAADVIRALRQELPVRYFQLDPSMKRGSSSPSTALRAFGQLRAELRTLTGAPVDDAALRVSIDRFNTNRRLLREAHALRREGGRLTSSELQVLVVSSMVMDRSAHSGLLREVLAERRARTVPATARRVRVHLSGHMCQAPKPALLDLIEDCGAQVVNDDLFTGWRHIATDVRAAGDPLSALVEWYAARNERVPCPTRTHGARRWDDYLPKAARVAGAEGVITLLVKFCEPHMYQFPELDSALARAGMPHLLLETEHEGMPLEAMRTRVESFVESIAARAARRASEPVERHTA